MGTFFKEQLHLKEPFQTFKSLTPIQHTTRTDRMKFLLPILLISLAALCNIQPAAANTARILKREAPEEEAQEAAQVEEEVEHGEGIDDEQLSNDDHQLLVETIDELVDDEPQSESGVRTTGDMVMLRWTYRQRVYLRKAAAFFRKADTNHTGQLTWTEYWRAVYWSLRKKGYSHGTIMKYKSAIKRTFYKLAGRNRLLSWAEVKREVARRIR